MPSLYDIFKLISEMQNKVNGNAILSFTCREDFLIIDVRWYGGLWYYQKISAFDLLQSNMTTKDQINYFVEKCNKVYYDHTEVKGEIT